MRKIGQTFTFLILIIALAVLVVFMVGAGRRAKKVRGVALVYEAWNTGNADLLDEVHSPDIVRYGPGSPWVEEDFEGNKQRLRDNHKDWPDFQLTMDFLIVGGDRTADRYTWRVSLPDGKEVVGTGVCHHRWEGGKIVEVWEYMDWLGMYQQLGYKLVPPK
jgi:ketosteroid isomerase-like protein